MGFMHSIADKHHEDLIECRSSKADGSNGARSEDPPHDIMWIPVGFKMEFNAPFALF